jgi:hypothetical protein
MCVSQRLKEAQLRGFRPLDLMDMPESRALDVGVQVLAT